MKPKFVNGLAPFQTQKLQMALHQDMPSHLHLPGCQTFTTSKIPGPLQQDNQRLQMAWHHIKLRSRRWPCIKICQAICTYQAAKHSQPPKYLAHYSTTTKGCKWLGTTSNSEAADCLASRYAKPSAPTRLPNIHNLQNTWPTTAWQPKVVNGLAPHQTQEPQMALHQDMPSHLHLPGRQTFTTSNHLDMPEQTKHFILETNWKERFKYSHHRYLLKNNTYYFNRINTFQYPVI